MALIKPFARRTERLTHALRQIGFALGGQAGARLARALRMPTSADTLLRIVAKTPLPETGQPRVVGGDEWAWRRGHRYGTILVDLEAHRVLDLLPDRSAHSLAQWLKAHPSIAILTRDRSVEYAQGMRLGAPEAVQVADRWHLLKNLHDVLKRFFEGQHTRIKSLLEHQQVTTWPQPFVRCPAEQQRRTQKRQRRQARYDRVLRLYQAGMPIRHIAQAVGISTTTIHRYVHEGYQPNQGGPRAQASRLDPYRAYLERRYDEGCQQAVELWREITDQGFTGSLRQVYRWVQPLKQQKRGQDVSAKDRVVVPSARRLARLFLQQQEQLDKEGQRLVKGLCQEAKLKRAYGLAQGFKRLVQGTSAVSYADWKQSCLASEVPCFVRFAQLLARDEAAVLGALVLPWSNGQVEGQITRLKLIKRQMYGRAGFALLRQRVVYRSE